MREGTLHWGSLAHGGSLSQAGLWVQQGSRQWSIPAALGQTGGRRGKPWPPCLGDAGHSGAIFNPLLAEPPRAGGVLQGGGRATLLSRLWCPSLEGLNFYPGFRSTFNPQLLANNALAKLGKMHLLPMSGAGLPPGS